MKLKRLDNTVEAVVNVGVAMEVLTNYFLSYHRVNSKEGKVYRGYYNDMIDRFIDEHEENGDMKEACLLVYRLQDLVNNNKWKDKGRM